MIDDKTFERVAVLAKLSFNTDEKKKILEEMTKVLSYCQKLNEVNTDDIEPLIFLGDEINIFREDVAELKISKEEALLNAPQKNSDYFKVPKFLDRE